MWAFASVLVVVALGAGTYWGLQHGPGSDESRMRHALQRGAAYLGETELRGDDTWIATQGAMKLGQDFRTWAETLQVNPIVESDIQHDPLASRTGAGTEGHLWSLRWLPETPVQALPAPDPAFELGRPFSSAMSDGDLFAILRVMGYAAVCPRLGDADRRSWLNELRAPSQSYLLTHQLLALMIGHNRGCLDATVVEPLRAELATRLWLEQSADSSGIHDLSVERMAVLCYAQLCDWLPWAWAEQVVAAQQPTGSWGERNPGVHPRVIARPEHTAALAFYVLAAVWQEKFGEAAPISVPAQGR